MSMPGLLLEGSSHTSWWIFPLAIKSRRSELRISAWAILSCGKLRLKLTIPGEPQNPPSRGLPSQQSRFGEPSEGSVGKNFRIQVSRNANIHKGNRVHKPGIASAGRLGRWSWLTWPPEHRLMELLPQGSLYWSISKWTCSISKSLIKY